MNQIFSYLQMMSKSVDVFNSSIQLCNYYNSIYFRTFHYALTKKMETEGDDIRKLCDIEAFYNLWLKIMDKEFDKELKSMSFTSLLSKYVNSIIDLHSLYRRTGLPVEYLDCMFLSYVHNIMSLLTSSTSKESKLSSHDTIYLKGRARLLHYRSIIKKDNEKRDSAPLLIVYAPINRFHIMDLNPKRSVVRNLLSNGLDVYLLDLGYPTGNAR